MHEFLKRCDKHGDKDEHNSPENVDNVQILQLSQKIKWFQVLQSITDNSIKLQSLIYKQLNVKNISISNNPV